MKTKTKSELEAQRQILRAVTYANNKGKGYKTDFLKGAELWTAFHVLVVLDVLQLRNITDERRGYWINEQKRQQWTVDNS